MDYRLFSVNATNAVYDNSLQFRRTLCRLLFEWLFLLPLWPPWAASIATLPNVSSAAEIILLLLILQYLPAITSNVRAHRSSLQTTVHILCLVVRLPGDVSCRMKAVQMGLFFSPRLLSPSLFVSQPPHLSSQLAAPLLHTNRWTKSWLQTRAGKTV